MAIFNCTPLKSHFFQVSKRWPSAVLLPIAGPRKIFVLNLTQGICWTNFIDAFFKKTNFRHFMRGSRRQKKLKRSFNSISTRLLGSVLLWSNISLRLSNFPQKMAHDSIVVNYHLVFSGVARPGEAHWAAEGRCQGQGSTTQSGSGLFYPSVNVPFVDQITLEPSVTCDLKPANCFLFRRGLQCANVCLETKPALT